MRDLRIDEEPDRCREGRPLGGLRHALDAERPADPDLPLQNLLGEIGKPDELAANILGSVVDRFEFSERAVTLTKVASET